MHNFKIEIPPEEITDRYYFLVVQQQQAMPTSIASCISASLRFLDSWARRRSIADQNINHNSII